MKTISVVTVPVGTYLVKDHEDLAYFFQYTEEGLKQIAVWTTGVLWKETGKEVKYSIKELDTLSPEMTEIIRRLMETDTDHIDLDGDIQSPKISED